MSNDGLVVNPPTLIAKDTQAVLHAMFAVLNRCEEDGIPEPILETHRPDDEPIGLDVSWFPKIYSRHDEVSTTAIEDTFSITLEPQEGTGYVRYEGPMFDVPLVKFCVYL